MNSDCKTWLGIIWIQCSLQHFLTAHGLQRGRGFPEFYLVHFIALPTLLSCFKASPVDNSKCCGIVSPLPPIGASHAKGLSIPPPCPALLSASSTSSYHCVTWRRRKASLRWVLLIVELPSSSVPWIYLCRGNNSSKSHTITDNSFWSTRITLRIDCITCPYCPNVRPWKTFFICCLFRRIRDESQTKFLHPQ